MDTNGEGEMRGRRRRRSGRASRGQVGPLGFRRRARRKEGNLSVCERGDTSSPSIIPLYTFSFRARALSTSHTHALVGSQMERYAEHVPSNSTRLSRRCMDAAPSCKHTDARISNNTTAHAHTRTYTYTHTHTDLHHLIYASPPAAAGCSGATISVSPRTSFSSPSNSLHPGSSSLLLSPGEGHTAVPPSLPGGSW